MRTRFQPYSNFQAPSPQPISLIGIEDGGAEGFTRQSCEADASMSAFPALSVLVALDVEPGVEEGPAQSSRWLPCSPTWPRRGDGDEEDGEEEAHAMTDELLSCFRTCNAVDAMPAPPCAGSAGPAAARGFSSLTLPYEGLPSGLVHYPHAPLSDVCLDSLPSPPTSRPAPPPRCAAHDGGGGVSGGAGGRRPCSTGYVPQPPASAAANAELLLRLFRAAPGATHGPVGGGGAAAAAAAAQ